jgi:hypothetical protein
MGWLASKKTIKRNTDLGTVRVLHGKFEWIKFQKRTKILNTNIYIHHVYVCLVELAQVTHLSIAPAGHNIQLVVYVN